MTKRFKKKLARIALFCVALFTLCTPLIVTGTAAALFGTNSVNEACQGLNPGGANASTGCDPANDSKANRLITAAINIMSLLGGIICVIIIIISGIRLILAAGDANGITTARNSIIYAVVGLVVVAMAQLLVRFVLGKATK